MSGNEKKNKIEDGELAAYDAIRGKLDTGDIVLFSGFSRFSRVIQVVTRCQYSHIGMVVKSTDLDTLLLWESTTLTSIPDMETGRAVKGVQIHQLSNRVFGYVGLVAVRRLSKSPTLAQRKKLNEFRAEVKGRPYEQSLIELAKAALDIFSPDQEDENLSSLFCSELVAEAYQRMGILKENKPSNEYTPSDFVKGSTMGGDLNVKLGPIEFIKE